MRGDGVAKRFEFPVDALFPKRRLEGERVEKEV